MPPSRDEPESESTVKVTDKRHFTSDGQRRREDGRDELAREQAAERAPSAPSPLEAPGQQRSPRRQAERALDFATFITSLSSAALLYLGEFPNPETGEKLVNLEYARHHIDIIAMLSEKTAGNLTSDERNLVETLLAELQLKFVQATR